MFTEDLDAFLSTSEHATAGSYNAGGGAVSINGIFDHEFVEISVGRVPIAGERPVFLCKSSDVASDPVGDAITVSSTAYTVIAAEPDGTGMVRLILNE
jgi:hypothetical protein